MLCMARSPPPPLHVTWLRAICGPVAIPWASLKCIVDGHGSHHKSSTWAQFIRFNISLSETCMINRNHWCAICQLDTGICGVKYFFLFTEQNHRSLSQSKASGAWNYRPHFVKDDWRSTSAPRYRLYVLLFRHGVTDNSSHRYDIYKCFT
jgi:hypothetical protein